jgi:hypothetical protein
MWDFNLSQALGLMLKTMPFIFFRMLIYFAITLAYVVVTGLGAGIGYGVTAFGDNPGGGAFYGALFGFAGVSGILYWAREYLLYLVKAGHISVLVEALADKPLPAGRGQIQHAQQVVKERFKESSVLFAMDQLIKGILRAVNRLVMSLTNWLPVANLDQLARFVTSILNVSLTYVDEVILAYNIKTNSENPWQSSKDGLILYAQNYKVMLKNAFFLMLLMYLLAFLVFLIFLAPVAALMGLFPGSVGGWSFIIALLFAWSIKAALLEPLAITAMMQVYFKTIEGQQPNPEWDERLSMASDKFREIRTKAENYVAEKINPLSPAGSSPGRQANASPELPDNNKED